MEKDSLYPEGEQDENGWCHPWGRRKKSQGRHPVGAEHLCVKQRNELVQLAPALVTINGNLELKKTTSFLFPNPGCSWS